MPRDKTPRLQNIPLRTDLGTKLRRLFQEQLPSKRALDNADFAKLEASLGAQPCIQDVAPRIGLRVRRKIPHPAIPVGTLGTIDVVHENGQDFWVVDDTGGFNGWTSFDAWQPAKIS
jgi:hypothetical protein